VNYTARRANWPDLRATLAQSVALTLPDESRRFLAINARVNDPPTRFQWVLGGEYLRATTDDGHTATISKAGFAELVRLGLLVRGAGCADCIITDTGRKAAL